jgi:hypothetical protein
MSNENCETGARLGRALLALQNAESNGVLSAKDLAAAAAVATGEQSCETTAERSMTFPLVHASREVRFYRSRVGV